jgi:hypothetical protein
MEQLAGHKTVTRYTLYIKHFQSRHADDGFWLGKVVRNDELKNLRTRIRA